MWRDRILTAQKEKGVSIKFMADFARLSEKSVTRILNGKTQTPYVGNVIELGASVGLSPQELFSETGLVVGDCDLAFLKAEVDRLTSELGACAAEAASLRGTVTTLTAENDLLRLKLDHKDELIKHKDEILRLLRQE